jgi:CDP-2,3-bis-(O-geranylgeranyl)-sn-glycerol synthase
MSYGEILALLFVANGAPIVATRLFGTRAARPVDGGRTLPDGRPLFGPAKTWRGIVSSLAASAAATSLLGYGAGVGAIFGALAMLGDLSSSFIKRRFGAASSAMALGLDQIPESLFPLLWFRAEWKLSEAEVGELVCVFLALELAISPVLCWLRIRRQPY